jgi:nucleolar protein 53
MAPVTKRTTRSSQKKPYEQPPSAAKGKGKAKAATDLGAPATLSQSSRKGKKAWRKNVDVREEEEALEEARAEERQTG